jgi:hypothetical protein
MIEEGKKDKTQYIDEEFLICLERLIPEDLDNPLFNNVNKIEAKECLTFQWERIDKIMPFCKNFLSPALKCEDLKQSAYGGCYFLVAVAGLINTSLKDLERFKRIFLTSESNDKGVYAIRLFLQGEPQVVIIDDLIPCKMDKDEKLIPAFSSSRDGESALLILEKAWAKFNYNCYLKTWQGTPQEALAALCEAPCVFEFNKMYLNKNKADLLWKKLVEANKKKWILSTNTEDTDEELSRGEELIGLPKFHAFCIMDIYEIKIASYDENTKNLEIIENPLNEEGDLDNKDYSQYLRLIKLRNTTNSNSNFNGLFQANSKLWSEALKKILNFDMNFYQGTILITYEEYLKYFPWTFICKYEDSYTYRYAKFTISNNTINGDLIYLDKLNVLDLKNYNTHPGHSRKLTPNIINYANNQIERKQSIEDRIFYTNDFYLNESKIQENEMSNDQVDLSHISINLNQQQNYLTEKPLAFSEIRLKEVNSNSTINKTNMEDDHKNFNLIEEKKQSQNDNFLLKEEFEQKKENTNNILWSDLISKGDTSLIEMDNLVTACIDIPEGRTKCYITLHQPQLRYFREKIKDFKVPLAFIIVAKFIPEKKSYKFLYSEFINWEKLTLECNLTEGEYHIFAKSYWNYSDKCELVLSTYADLPCELYTLNKQEIPHDWLEKITIDIAKKNPKKEIMKMEDVNLLSSNVVFNNNNYSGFGIFYYENSSKKANMIIKLNLRQVIGFKCLNFNLENLDEIKILIEPKNSAYLIFQITLFPWLCKLDYNQEVWFEQPFDFIVDRYNEIGMKNKIIIEEGLSIDCIPHERGYLIIIENQTENKFNGFFTFEDLNDYEIEDHPEVSSVILILGSQSKTYINIKGTRKDLDTNFNLNYKYNFEKIES